MKSCLFFFFFLFSLVCADDPVVKSFAPPDGTEVAIILWSPTNSKHAIMRTYGNSVYMSINGGVDWSSISTKTGAPRANFRGIFLNQDVVVMIGNDVTSYLITEFGTKSNFVKLNLERVTNLDFHPLNKNNILLLDYKGDLFVTTNAKDFQLVAKSVTSFEWSIISQPDSFFYTTMDSTLSRYSLTTGKAVVVLKNTTFVQEKENTIFATSDGNLFVSSDGKTFTQARFALSFEATKSYNVMEYSSGTYLVEIGEISSSLGYVFKSDSTGVRYSLTIPFVGNTNGRSDFEKVHGMEAILIANEVPNVDVVRARGTPLKRTRISYNNGVDWQFLNAPPVDIEGRPIVCLGACHLHLHSFGAFPKWGPVYSTSNTVGIIIATGNIGTHLSDTAFEINTYMSRDAGLTWQQIHKGSSIYEMGDHGGIILLVDNVNPTNTIKYSLNEGLSWKTLKIDEQPITVKNIMIEPTNTGKSFILYGLQDSRSIVYHLDFESIHERNCDSNDYEDFSPNDGRAGQPCVLGRKVVYTRKRRSSLCFNAGDSHIKSVSNCSCTASDYECDVGYAKTPEHTCIAVSNDPEKIPSPCPPGSFYAIKTGFRKIAGDTCVGGAVDGYGPYFQLLLACPKSDIADGVMTSSVPTSLIVIVVFLAIAIIISLFVLYKNRDRVQSAWTKWYTPKPSYLPLSVHMGEGSYAVDAVDDLNTPNTQHRNQSL